MCMLMHNRPSIYLMSLGLLLQRLQEIQNAAARLVNLLDYHEEIILP